MIGAKILLFIVPIILSLANIGAVLNFEDENFEGYEADRYDWSKHPCRRKCREGEKPRKCHYVFVVEMYSTMSKACYACPFNITDCFRPHCISADGVQKTIYVANRQLPGPTIEVCKNDEVIVDVRNAMIAESTAIHWHGIKQIGTPYMDGTPFITQCPILPGNSFRYTFKASSSGSYFWHSHIGSQRDDGLFGPLIIHPQPSENNHKKLYDIDNHVMIINDWTHLESNAGFIKDYHAGSASPANSILINGIGRFRKLERENATSQCTLTAVFQVEKNFRYIFRLISAGATDCPIQVTIDNHTMSVISMDGNDIHPVEVDTVHIWNGERIDVIVNANKEIDNYWIRYRDFGSCKTRNPDTRVYQVAILRYKSAKPTDPKSPIGYDLPMLSADAKVLNPHNKGTEDAMAISIPSLHSLAKDDDSNLKRPDHQFYIAYDFYTIDNYMISIEGISTDLMKLNHISLKLPSFPLLSQTDMIDKNTFCNSTTLKDENCVNNECACTHVLQVKLNSVVELVIVDEGQGLKSLGNFNHPLHLHRNSFRVVAMESLTKNISVDLVKKMDREGKIKRKLSHAPLKDTVKVPTNGYTIVRFHANNPGYWLYHCHVDQHINIGMALIFKVGEHKDFPRVPRYFPTCGDF